MTGAEILARLEADGILRRVGICGDHVYDGARHYCSGCGQTIIPGPSVDMIAGATTTAWRYTGNRGSRFSVESNPRHRLVWRREGGIR